VLGEGLSGGRGAEGVGWGLVLDEERDRVEREVLMIRIEECG
jgi:hypothetical protein